MSISEFPNNFNQLKQFIANVSSDPKNTDKIADNVYKTLSKDQKAAFEHIHLDFNSLTSAMKDSIASKISKADYKGASEVISTLFKNQISEAKKILTRNPAFVSSGGKNDQTSNPIRFLSEEGKLTKSFPKNMVAVMKAKYDRAITPSQANAIHKEISTIWSSTNPPKESDVPAIVHMISESLPQMRVSNVEGELEQMARSIIDMYHQASQIEQKFIESRNDLAIEPDVKEKMSQVLSDLTLRNAIGTEYDKLIQRYTDTAMLACEYDEICGTSFMPKCTEAEIGNWVDKTTKNGLIGKVDVNLRGFLQEKMTYVPLSVDSNPQTAEKRLNLIEEFIPLENYQQAVLRATELCDADLHGGNVALVPIFKGEVLGELTKLNDKNFNAFLEILIKYKGEGVAEIGHFIAAADQQMLSFLRQLTGQKADEVINKELLNSKLMELAGTKLTASSNDELKSGLSFEIKLFDVDLTMPESPDKGVTGSAVPVRNILMAMTQLRDQPLEETVKRDLAKREENLDVLRSVIEKRFSEGTLNAYNQRMAALIDAGKEEVMTARGLVWRTFPNYARVEQLFEISEPIFENTYDIYFHIGFKKMIEGLLEYLPTKQKNIEDLPYDPTIKIG